MARFETIYGEAVDPQLVATTTDSGLMSASDKSKLDGIAKNANNYTHPSSHAASMITPDASHRFVTDTQISAWNGKASTSAASQSANGLMSAADKKKLDGISSGATAVSVDSSLSSTSTNPVQNKVINSALAGKASTATVTTSAAGLMSAADKTKLDGIAAGANAYSHPSTHPATMISTDASHRFVTDSEKSTWNSKAGTSVATQTANGLMSLEDKKKLDGIASGANEVNIDSALSATSTNPVQNKVIKAALDGKANTSHGTHVPSTCNTISDWNSATSNGWYMASGGTNGPVADTWFMGYVLAHNSNYVIQELYGFTSSTDAYSIPKYMRVKENGTWGEWKNVTVSKQVPSNAKFTDTVYSHPSTHPATMISTDASHRFVSDSEKSTWNSKAAGNHTHDLSGLINNLSTGASTPVDADYFVSQYTGGGTSTTSYHRRPISTIWNYVKSKADSVYQAKGSYASTAAASQSASGLMSAADKKKLDGIAAGANAYSHPSTHPATMISTDASHRFVSDSQISAWNAKASTSAASQSANGLMSAADKKKLDGIAAGANAYSHPSYTARSSGLYKITVDGAGHVSAVASVTKADITALGIPGSDTNSWRGIQNNLTSDSTSDSLSAAQGKALKASIDSLQSQINTLNSWKTNVLNGATAVLVSV